MVTVSSLEEAIVNLLVNAPQQKLSQEKLLNTVVGRIGSTENPVEMQDYERALVSLLDQRIIERTQITTESYEPSSTQIKPGYRLS
ncbi:hypothetical protein J4210_05715 [Candidatus Woesearchaeota archaeon]|nr:hypothetical protein [Candidatus Woesearchaeota archaeon]